MNFQTKNGLYLDMDCLYDTRLATLENISTDYAKLCLAYSYMQRDEDVFPHLKKKEFRQLYKLRDTAILAKAQITKITTVINNFISEAVARNKSSPFKSSINVFLNVWPYKIERGIARKMIEPLAESMGRMPNVHLINYPPEKLTLEFCRENFSLMVMYDYEDWLEVHTKNDGFATMPIPDISLFVPELYLTENKPSDQEIAFMTKESMHPFRTLEKAAQLLVGLQYIEVQYYCADLPEGFLSEIETDYRQKNEYKE